MSSALKVKKDHVHASGGRKAATARVFLQKGKGQIMVNGRPLDAFYQPDLDWYTTVRQPLELLEVADQYDVVATVRGGGNTGQAEALRLGIAKALDALERKTLKVVDGDDDVERPWHKALRQAGYLTRDDRRVLPKLVGLVKHRKRKQFSKR